jgi:hypothetical protein
MKLWTKIILNGGFGEPTSSYPTPGIGRSATDCPLRSCHSAVFADPAGARLLETRKSLVSTWMRAAEVLDEQGEEILAGDVRYFAMHLPPVLTDRQRLAVQLILFKEQQRQVKPGGPERAHPRILEWTR